MLHWNLPGLITCWTLRSLICYRFLYIPLSISLILVQFAHLFVACFKYNYPSSFSSLQFIREYTGKVDELIKDKIESKKEEKAKENEEHDIIKQQVYM